MRDFTFRIYDSLLSTIISKGYECIPYLDYIERGDSISKFVILRHDVDGKPDHSLHLATVQNSYGVRGSYYFRNVPWSFDKTIVSRIVDLDHEIGFHYEDLSQCKGNTEAAIINFEKFLGELREFYPVKTLCMHGSPLSKYDNRQVWKKYNYRNFGLIGEPYFDTDFDKVWYITDTGRGWNNTSSVRDRVSNLFNIPISSTTQLIDFFLQDRLPQKIMINIHPQRWTDNQVEWYRELVVQNAKNVLKRGLNVLRPQSNFDNRQLHSSSQ